MNELDENSNVVIPMCIFHYNDKITNIYKSFIDNPTKIKKDKHYFLTCTNSLPDKWKLYSSFYVISPMLRPIPTGLKLINANRSENSLDTKEIKYGYDPFDIQSNSVSFLAWTKQVRDTVPLYLHITPEGKSYPSFDPIPPQKEGWTQNIMSPIYVLIDKNKYIGPDKNKQDLSVYDKDEYGIPMFKFSSIDGRCLPDPSGISLTNCFLLTDKNILGEKQTNNIKLLNQLKEDKKQQNKSINIGLFFRKLSPAIIILFNTLFFTSLFICIIILVKK